MFKSSAGVTIHRQAFSKSSQNIGTRSTPSLISTFLFTARCTIWLTALAIRLAFDCPTRMVRQNFRQAGNLWHWFPLSRVDFREWGFSKRCHMLRKPLSDRYLAHMYRHRASADISLAFKDNRPFAEVDLPRSSRMCTSRGRQGSNSFNGNLRKWENLPRKHSALLIGRQRLSMKR